MAHTNKVTSISIMDCGFDAQVRDTNAYAAYMGILTFASGGWVQIIHELITTPVPEGDVLEIANYLCGNVMTLAIAAVGIYMMVKLTKQFLRAMTACKWKDGQYIHACADLANTEAFGYMLEKGMDVNATWDGNVLTLDSMGRKWTYRRTVMPGRTPREKQLELTFQDGCLYGNW